MDWTLIYWLFLLALTAFLIFTAVFYLISYTDLECDYVNPIDLSRRINTLIIPEMATHIVLTVMLLSSGHWLDFLLNVPLVIWNIMSVMNRTYMVDATQIFRILSKQKKIGFIKLGFYMISFFLYLYRLVYHIVGAYVSSSSKMGRYVYK
eukprot:TRINITY_DN1739_c0_g1_i1.p1 TRINITY_DN1739_c0_g1~~TRINITY_DN1739_c0_g1_i1.p1  ORF type:complete len:150 (-),score=13.53 TRINITY_DN1739_c0_g1_i1:78-527(-)